MSNLRQAAQQALEALELHRYSFTASYPINAAITALRAALAEPPTNQCGETCERAKLCAVCARGLATGDNLSPTEPVAWRNAALRVGEDLSSVGPDGYYDMTAKQWLDWAMLQEPCGKNSLTTPPQRKPLTQEEIEQATREVWRSLPSDFDYTTSSWVEIGIRYAEQAHGIKP